MTPDTRKMGAPMVSIPVISRPTTENSAIDTPTIDTSATDTPTTDTPNTFSLTLSAPAGISLAGLPVVTIPAASSSTVSAQMVNAPMISIVIPAYNESRRLPSTLDKILKYLESHPWNAEVIVVDDGSTDQTAAIVRGYAERNRMVRLLENPGNRGKGYSIRNGMLHAGGDILLFTDADYPCPMSELEKLIEGLSMGNDVVIGSRRLGGARQTKPQPLHRRMLGRIFNHLTSMLLDLDFKDTQCGAKAFSRRAAGAIFRLQRTERWGFDPELLVLARMMGYRIKEISVTVSHDEGSRISPIQDGFRMLRDLMEISRYERENMYLPEILKLVEATN